MRNVTEDLVAELYRELLPQVTEAHDCPLCREDAMVYTLNRLAPHYVATPKGEVVSRLGVQAGQSRTDGLVVMLEALRFVAANPRCGRAPAAPG